MLRVVTSQDETGRELGSKGSGVTVTITLKRGNQCQSKTMPNASKKSLAITLSTSLGFWLPTDSEATSSPQRVSRGLDSSSRPAREIQDGFARQRGGARWVAAKALNLGEPS